MLIGTAVKIDRTKSYEAQRKIGCGCYTLAASASTPLNNGNLDKILGGNYGLWMVIDSIRKFNHAVPFVPYEIHTAIGETYEVPHPDFILVSPRGSYVVVIDPKDPREAPNHINALLIERATLLDGQKRRRIRKH